MVLKNTENLFPCIGIPVQYEQIKVPAFPTFLLGAHCVYYINNHWVSESPWRNPCSGNCLHCCVHFDMDFDGPLVPRHPHSLLQFFHSTHSLSLPGKLLFYLFKSIHAGTREVNKYLPCISFEPWYGYPWELSGLASFSWSVLKPFAVSGACCTLVHVSDVSVQETKCKNILLDVLLILSSNSTSIVKLKFHLIHRFTPFLSSLIIFFSIFYWEW